MARAGPMACQIASPGSMLVKRRSTCGPVWAWKYHHGTPFIANSTAVSRPSNGAMATAGEGLGWAADHQAIGRDRHILGTSRHDRQVRIIGRKARREVPAEGAGAEDADFEVG
jgi:hypothetical protein